MNVEPAEVAARWPSLRPLLALTDPPWSFVTLASGVLIGSRAHEAYAEGLWVIDERHTGINRSPRAGRSNGQVAATVNFAGTLSDAVDLLARPVRWE
jgi:hypothetical protein